MTTDIEALIKRLHDHAERAERELVTHSNVAIGGIKGKELRKDLRAAARTLEHLRQAVSERA